MSDVLELENEIYQDELEQSTEQVEEEFIAPSSTCSVDCSSSS